MKTIDGVIAEIKADIKLRKMELAEMVERGEAAWTNAESKRSKAILREVTDLKYNLARAEDVKREEDENDRRMHDVHPSGAESPFKTASVHVGNEPHTYSRANDPKGDGKPFLNDVVAAYRGNPQANERLSRHMREVEVDRGYEERTAGYAGLVSNFPNLVVPAYLTSQYAAKPSAARPFADVYRHVDLPPQGLKVELAKANTSTTAALQTTELVAAGGGNYDADPLEISVQTAESWQLVLRQAIERGVITEQVVIGDMLDQMHALIDSTLLTQATTGLFDVATRIDASGSANDLTLCRCGFRQRLRCLRLCSIRASRRTLSSIPGVGSGLSRLSALPGR